MSSLQPLTSAQYVSSQFLQFQCMPSIDYENTLDYAFLSTPPSSHSLNPAKDEFNRDDFEPAVYGFPQTPSLIDSLPPSPLYEMNSELHELPVRKASTRLRSGNRVPRPRNAFMIFRSELWAEKKITKSVERDHRHISRIIGHCWNQLPEAQKDLWRCKAEQEKIQHGLKYPGYRFSPTTRLKKPIKRNTKRNGKEEMLRCQKVAELLLEGKQGIDLDSAVKSLGPPPEEVDKAAKPLAPLASSSRKNGGRGMSRRAPSAQSEPPAFRSPLLPPAETQQRVTPVLSQYQLQPAAASNSLASMNEYYVQQISTHQEVVPLQYQTSHGMGPVEISYQPQQSQYYAQPQWSMATPSGMSSNMVYANVHATHYNNEQAMAPSYHAYPPASMTDIRFIDPFSYTAELPTSVTRTSLQTPPTDPLHWNPTGFRTG